MNMRIALVLLVALFFGCSSDEPRTPKSPNRWSDARLWPILEAQEHRNTTALCAFLKDTSATVREAVALAFASVQGTAAVPCLLGALHDASPQVRSMAVFALGFIADSSVVQEMAELAATERDTAVQRAYLNASFLAMQRNGSLTDPNAMLSFLESSTGQDRVRAADALRRLPDTTVKKLGGELMALMGTENSEVRQFLILAMKKLGTDANRKLLQRIVVEQDSDGERVNALRVCGAIEGMSGDAFFFNALRDPVTTVVALEILRNRPAIDAHQCLWWEPQITDTATRIGLLGLALKHGEEQTRDSALTKLNALSARFRSPYLVADVMRARAMAPAGTNVDELLAVMTSDRPAIERQAAFECAVLDVRNKMMRSRFATRAAQFADLGSVARTAIGTGDPGLISATAELLVEEEADAIGIMFPKEMDSTAMAPLQPIRDLEARILLAKVIAKRDGIPEPAHRAPSFNHPINVTRLRALPQAQRYRITTTKGTIIIATDVNDCPGSSLAFDSLVTAGYYNGKAFHRMVPNFVAQGGCPRGDGYGGMPWTLRTEIGRKLFTSGSVGLASAGRDTESCQFFITHSATPNLDGRYTRFGEVVEGMDVVWMLHVGDLMERVERIE